MRRSPEILLALVGLAALGGLAGCDGGGDGGGGGGSGGESSGAYCDAVRAFDSIEDDLDNPDVPPGASFQEQMRAMREQFEPLRDRIGDLRRAAPSEIRADVQDLADAVDELLDVFLTADSIEEMTAVSERMAELQRQLQGARDRVAEFTEEECGIDLDAESDGGEEGGAGNGEEGGEGAR